MDNPNNGQSVYDRNIDDTDHVDESIDESSSVSGGETSRDEGVGVMQWLQALDMQVTGACRAHERLKPLLKFNVSSGVAEDRLLSHLSQHFEPSEVGMLARCLCIPLVSIRVGKIDKQGTLLCPTGVRGNLTLTLLPTSDLRISFIGDDGRSERLLTLSSGLHCPSVTIEEIPADSSGRSFLIKIPDGGKLYFWCSEKSKLLGSELLEKMNDLLKRKPSLAELTGISESRLGYFATYLRGYLVGSPVTNTVASSVFSTISPSDTSADSPEICQNAQSAFSSSKPSRPRCYASQGSKSSPIYQGSLSPRSSSFKEGLTRNLSSLRSFAREKFKRRGDSHVSCADSGSLDTTDAASSPNQLQERKLPESIESCLFPSSSFLESLGKSTDPPFLSPASLQVPLMGSSLFSPYYCWCPPVASTLQYTVAPSQMPLSSSTESFALPPLSSMLLTSNPPLSLSELPSINFPPLLPESLVRLQLSMSTSQQIPTFTPLMCDSIVHIPVVDICSSGQGYLVSAGHAVSTNIPPLHPSLVNPLIPQTDSVVENSARETLRLLLSTSSPTNPHLMSVLPSVLTNSRGETQSVLVAGSRGLYSGATDVGAIANSITAMGLVSLSEGPMGSSVLTRCIRQSNLADQLEKPSGSGSEEEGSVVPNLRQGMTD